MTLTDPDVDKGPAVDAPRPVEGTMHSWDI